MGLRGLIVLLVAAAVLGAAGGGLGGLGEGGSTTAPSSPGGELEARVVRIVDGDTLKVRVGGAEDTVRLTGIDTPESKKPGTPVECYALEADRELRRLAGGESVRLVLDREPRDRYDRLLAYVYRERDGAFVNERLVRGGYAETLSIAPNTRFEERFAEVEDAAREAARGLWGACR